jgi:hypothetical protein
VSARDPIHGLKLLRSQEASTRNPERNPHMLPCVPLKAKALASGRGAKLCLAHLRNGDRVPRHGGNRLSTRAAHAVHVHLALLCECNLPLSTSRQSSLLSPLQRPRARQSMAAKRHCCHGIGDWADAWRRLRSGSLNCITAGAQRRSPSVSRDMACIYRHGAGTLRREKAQ